MNKGIKIIGTILIVAFLLAPTIAYVQKANPLDVFKNLLTEIIELRKSLDQLKKEREALQKQLDQLEKPLTPVKPPIKPKPTVPVDPDELTQEQSDQVLPKSEEDELRRGGSLGGEPSDLDHEQSTKPATPKVSQYHDFEKNLPDYFEYKNYSQQNLGYFHSVWGKFTHPKNKEERWLLYITLEKLAELSSGKVIAVTVTQPSECKPCRLELIKPSVTGPFITPEQAQRIGVIIRELRIPAHIKVRFINGKLEVVK